MIVSGTGRNFNKTTDSALIASFATNTIAYFINSLLPDLLLLKIQILFKVKFKSPPKILAIMELKMYNIQDYVWLISR